MVSRLLVVALSALCCPALPRAAELATAPPLPTFALAAPPPDAGASPWHGLYVGTDVFAIGGKGVRGGFGGGGFAGYERAFPDGLVLGLEGGVGYSPGLWRWSPVTGFDVASASLKAGYDLGRVVPFVAADLLLARPRTRPFGYSGVPDTANAFLADTDGTKVFGRVGAGVDYALTNSLSLELAVSAGRGPGVAWP